MGRPRCYAQAARTVRRDILHGDMAATAPIQSISLFKTPGSFVITPRLEEWLRSECRKMAAPKKLQKTLFTYKKQHRRSDKLLSSKPHLPPLYEEVGPSMEFVLSRLA